MLRAKVDALEGFENFDSPPIKNTIHRGNISIITGHVGKAEI